MGSHGGVCACMFVCALYRLLANAAPLMADLEG